MAQGLVQGKVADNAGAGIGAATLSLVNLKDSTLWGFYITDDDGFFKFKNVPLGNFRLHISRMGYIPFAQNFETQGSSLEVGTLVMEMGDVQLSEVSIVDEAPPVTLKGDTLEFNAGSFHTQPNAVVEDLLKKLPGVEIESDGTMKINGQQINKVLVDGKEFFSSDPKVATRNLPAEAIKKVQVFDRKTDSEQMTGMDDGSQDMTINLKLKDEYKKGSFGNVSAGIGTNSRWMGKTSLNFFTEKNQYSIIANANNINEAGFSFTELLKFTGGLGNMMSGRNTMGGGMEQEGAFPVSWLTQSQSEGVNTQGTAGIRWSRDWGEKFRLTGNYVFFLLAPNRNSIQDRIYFLPDSSYSSIQNKNDDGLNLNHRIEFEFNFTPNSKTKFRFLPVVSYYNLNANSVSNLKNGNLEGTAGNTVLSDQINKSNTFIYSGTASFVKGFKRKGRTIAAEWTGNYRPAQGDLKLGNQLVFTTPDTTFATPLTQQRWTTAEFSNQQNVKLSFTEPMFFRWLAELSLTGNLNESGNEREVFSLDTISGLYSTAIQELSNNYSSQFTSGIVGAKARRQGKKMNFTAGLSWQQSQLEGQIPQTGFAVNEAYGRLLPNAFLEYNISQFRQFQFNYTSRMRAPTVTQLQPLNNNANPLFQQNGNPDLAPQTDHSGNVMLRLINPGRGTFFVTNFSGAYSLDGISQEQEIDSFGITKSRPINVDGIWNGNVNLTYSVQIKKLKSRFRFSPTYNLNRSITWVNGIENPSLNKTLRPSIRWTFSPNDSIEIFAGGSWSWVSSRFSAGNKTDLYRTNINAGVELELWKGISFEGEVNYSLIQNQNSVQSYPLVKASLSKSFLKGNQLDVRISAFDMLKRNLGLSQSTTINYSEILTFNTLSRYYMLTLSWKLTPQAKGGSTRGAMMKIIEQTQ